MLAEGVIASDVSVIPEKGCAFKIMVPDLGDVIDCFIPIAESNGEAKFMIGQNVVANIRKPYVSQGQVRFKVISVKLAETHGSKKT